MDTIKKEFRYDAEIDCDNCNGRGPNPFSYKSIMREENDVEERLSKKFLEFEDCAHNICFHCVESKSDGHSIPLEEIECVKCERDEKRDKEMENKINTYCHCISSVNEQIKKRNEEYERPKTYEELQMLNFRIINMVMGIPSLFPHCLDLCKDCNKDKLLYIGIRDKMDEIHGTGWRE